LDGLVAACKANGIQGVCITDHNTIAGALQLAAQASFPVIVGEEISSTAGEIIGYFLKQEIPAGLSPQATVVAIRDQGGLVAIPHPFDRLRWSSLKKQALLDIIDLVDIIEAFNSRTILPIHNRQALAFAKQHHKMVSAGSDCHAFGEAGNGFVVMDSLPRRENFLAQLATATLRGNSIPLSYHGSRLLQTIQAFFHSKS
jgi:predicted metal-dependent phosphoesterase TrpH